MISATLSYVQSLRAIGQSLDALHIDSFVLDKIDVEYSVYMERTRSKLKQAWEKVWCKSGAGSNSEFGRPARQNAMRFTASDIARLDAAGLSRRGDRNAAANATNLSLRLRVVGDYLDRKNASDFMISWSTSSVGVSFDDKREDFSAQNLYDGGVHMYLRRSNRVPAR